MIYNTLINNLYLYNFLILPVGTVKIRGLINIRVYINLEKIRIVFYGAGGISLVSEGIQEE